MLSSSKGRGGASKGRRPLSASAVSARQSATYNNNNNNNNNNNSNSNVRGEIFRRSSRVDRNTTNNENNNDNQLGHPSSPLAGREVAMAIYGDYDMVTGNTTRRTLNGPPTPKTSTLAPPPPVGPMIPIAPVVYASSFSPDARAVYKLVSHTPSIRLINPLAQYTLSARLIKTNLTKRSIDPPSLRN